VTLTWELKKSNCRRPPQLKHVVQQLSGVINRKQTRPLNQKRRNLSINESNCRKACKSWGMQGSPAVISGRV
jgi:hypothetical protein